MLSSTPPENKECTGDRVNKHTFCEKNGTNITGGFCSSLMDMFRICPQAKHRLLGINKLISMRGIIQDCKEKNGLLVIGMCMLIFPVLVLVLEAVALTVQDVNQITLFGTLPLVLSLATPVGVGSSTFGEG